MICFVLTIERMGTLHYASNKGHPEVVEILLNHTANINIVTKVIHIIRMSVFHSNL